MTRLKKGDLVKYNITENASAMRLIYACMNRTKWAVDGSASLVLEADDRSRYLYTKVLESNGRVAIVQGNALIKINAKKT